jgi:hypothetical protein
MVALVRFVGEVEAAAVEVDGGLKWSKFRKP